MWFRTVVLIGLCTTRIGGDEGLKYRFDYTYSQEADGWLKFHRMPSTWNDAKSQCFAEGAILASPVSDQRRDAILKLLANENVDAIFTGVHATLSSLDYASIEGIPLTRLPVTWSAGEPRGNSKNCLVMKPKNNGTVSDEKCSNSRPYVCYKKKTDLTITECGTHDTEYKLDARTGSCYKFHWRGVTWKKAYMTCMAEGGHLAIINSEQESLVLKELFYRYGDRDIISTNTGVSWMGLRDLRNGGFWRTIHGQTLREAGFERWSANQPDNARLAAEGEACGSIFRDGLLNDIYCGRSLAFICEKNPKSLENIV